MPSLLQIIRRVRPSLALGASSLAPRIIGIAGQSNADGRGTVANVTNMAGLAVPYPAVQLKQRIAAANGDPLVWTNYATDDLQPRAGAPNFGVELTLGRDLDAAVPGGFHLVKMAVGSSGLASNWLDSSGYPFLGGAPTLFDQFVAYIGEAETELGAQFAGLVWIQGETDAGSAPAAGAYSANLQTFVSELRAAVGQFPFVFVQLHSGCTQAQTATVRAQQAAAVAAIPDAAMIDCSDLTLTDGLHYDANSFVTMGKRLATAVLGQLAANAPPIANFTFLATALNVAFTDTSMDPDGTIVARAWNFGDGATSNLQHPSHAYAAPGAYNVELVSTDDQGGTHSVTKTVTVSSISITQDGPANVYKPQSAADYVSLGLASPAAHCNCDEGAGSLASTENGILFLPNGAPLYGQAVAGWASPFVGINSGLAAPQGFHTQSAILDMTAGRSVAWLIYMAWSALTTNRKLLVTSNNNNGINNGATVARVSAFHNAVLSMSANNHQGITVVRPYLWYRNATTDQSGLITPLEHIVNTHSEINAGATAFKGLGPPTGGGTSPQVLACMITAWVDAAAEAIATPATLATLGW